MVKGDSGLRFGAKCDCQQWLFDRAYILIIFFSFGHSQALNPKFPT